MTLEYLTDANGSPRAVVVPMADWENMLHANSSAGASAPWHTQSHSSELTDEMLQKRQEYLRSRGVRRTEWGQHADEYIREMRDNDRFYPFIMRSM